MSWRTSKHFARETDDDHRLLRGLARRLLVTLSSSALWQLVGRREGGNAETIDAEVFPGIGVYARPRTTGGSPEAVAVAIGDAKSTVVVATRDEATRKAVAAIAPDETAIFNSSAIVVVKADGTVEIRLANGVAVPLALKSDVDALRTWNATHTHLVATTGSAAAQTGTAAVSVLASPTMVGTSVLKAG